MVKYKEQDRYDDIFKGLAKPKEGTDKQEVLISESQKYPT